jgi:hypothetical protein
LSRAIKRVANHRETIMTLKQEAAACFADARELLAKHSAQDLGLQITSTRNMLPLTKHNMVVRTAANGLTCA